MVQWLGLGAFTARAWVQSLVRELKFLKLSSVAKKINEKFQAVLIYAYDSSTHDTEAQVKPVSSMVSLDYISQN